MNHYDVFAEVMSDTYNKKYSFKLVSLLRDYNNQDINAAIEDLTFALSFFQQKKDELKNLQGVESLCSKIVASNKLLENQND